MTQIVVVTDVHYGADYLRYVIRSSEYLSEGGEAPPHVCLYTARATFGFQPRLPNPETCEQLRDIALAAGGSRVIWRDDLPPAMDTVFGMFPEAEIVVELDSDEVLSPGLAQHVLKCYNAGLLDRDKYFLPTAHLWRSFRHICRGGDHPRLYVRRNAPTHDWHALPQPAPDYLYHFGYATTQRVQRYKWACSAHQNELRPEWWADIWGAYPYRLTDLHPVQTGLWNAEPCGVEVLPPCMADHPFGHLEVIS
jgi:hypothetical protein